MTRADVIVLGGGIIGCALADELAGRGQRVVVLERGTIGAEASSAAAGILSAQMDLPTPGPFFELCHAARALYPRWVADVERRSRQSVEFHVDGILYLAMTDRDVTRMERRARWQRVRGLRVERWSRAEVRRREPSVDGRLAGNFFFPTEAQVDNPRLMQALAIACRRRGVRLEEHTRVQRIVMRQQIVRGVATDRGTYTAPIVVNCLGSWASMGGGSPIPLPVEPARGQILAFQGRPKLFRHAVMSEQAYVVQRRDGRLLVGSTIEFTGFEKTLTFDGIHGILCGLQRMSRALTACRFLDAWAGFRPCTPDRLPILGQTAIGGLYVATGHFRHGILLAPITAQVMAELLLSGHSSLDLHPFRPHRFHC